jgi:hypothetical protein
VKTLVPRRGRDQGVTITIHSFIVRCTLVIALLLTAGCSRSPDAGGVGGARSEASRAYLLAEEPAGARGVLEVKEDLEKRDQPDQWTAVVLLARIGGAEGQTWDPARAAFTMVDLSLVPEAPPSHDAPQHDADGCPFCRAKKNKRLAATAIVEVVDGEGQVPAVDARKLLGLAEGQTVVVRGEARIDGLGNLAVRARGVHLRRQTPEGT